MLAPAAEVGCCCEVIVPSNKLIITEAALALLDMLTDLSLEPHSVAVSRAVHWLQWSGHH